MRPAAASAFPAPTCCVSCAQQWLHYAVAMGRARMAERCWGLLRALVWPLLALLPAVAHADEIPPDFSARLLCKAERKYALCVVSVSATPGSRITYAEANVLAQPPFLRSVGTKATFSEEKMLEPKLRIGFVADGPGKGEVVVQARAVVCANKSCPHFAKVIRSVVIVPP